MRFLLAIFLAQTLNATVVQTPWVMEITAPTRTVFVDMTDLLGGEKDFVVIAPAGTKDEDVLKAGFFTDDNWRFLDNTRNALNQKRIGIKKSTVSFPNVKPAAYEVRYYAEGKPPVMKDKIYVQVDAPKATPEFEPAGKVTVNRTPGEKIVISVTDDEKNATVDLGTESKLKVNGVAQ